MGSAWRGATAAGRWKSRGADEHKTGDRAAIIVVTEAKRTDRE